MKRNLNAQQVRFRRAVKKTAISSLVVLASLFTGVKIGQHQEKERFQEVLAKEFYQHSEAEERATYFQKDAANLALQNIELKRYADEAQTLAESMKFYPTEPDSISALPEEEQEKAVQKMLEYDAKAEKKHNEILKTLGVDTNLLYRVQRGPKLPE